MQAIDKEKKKRLQRMKLKDKMEAMFTQDNSGQSASSQFGELSFPSYTLAILLIKIKICLR